MAAKTFGLIIPVFNEETTLDAVLDRLLALPGITRFVVVNDGSTDGSGVILRRRLEQDGDRLRVVTHVRNQGKGAAVRSALSLIGTDFAAIQDADAEYNPEDLKPIFARLLESGADVVFGSRFLKDNPNLYPAYLWGNKFLTACINVLGGGKLTDAYTCYKAMSVDRWRTLNLTSNGFELEAEIAVKCLRAHWKVVEVPIRYAPRSFSEGKKIRPSDALKGLFKAISCLFFKTP